MTDKLEKQVEPIIQTTEEHTNLVVKNKYKVENGKKVIKEQGLNPGEYVVGVKTFPEGKEFKSSTYFKDKARTQPQLSYLVKVEVNGQLTGFFIKEHEHEVFKSLPVGEPIKIGVIKDSFINSKTMMETFYDKVVFEWHNETGN